MLQHVSRKASGIGPSSMFPVLYQQFDPLGNPVQSRTGGPGYPKALCLYFRVLEFPTSDGIGVQQSCHRKVGRLDRHFGHVSPQVNRGQPAAGASQLQGILVAHSCCLAELGDRVRQQTLRQDPGHATSLPLT